ncbi:MAG: hypothetical protein KCHDKBKB_00608 [Elusimicrobia bacterium]|nr:hypothetical protein [Elusimicrobiota bacterium]
MGQTTQVEYKKDCDHKYIALGFDTFSKTDEVVEAVVAIACEKCGLFRTKILTFRRELTKGYEYDKR